MQKQSHNEVYRKTSGILSNFYCSGLLNDNSNYQNYDSLIHIAIKNKDYSNIKYQ